MVLEARELDELDHLADPLGAARTVPVEHLERKSDVLGHRTPVVENGVLKDDPVVAVEPRLVRLLAIDHHLARGRRDEVADDAEERRLATPGRADQRDELARTHLEVDLLQRADAAAREVLRQRLERDDRSLLVHTKCSGARLTTSFSVRTMRRKKAMPRSAAMMLVAQRLSGELA